MNKGNNILTSFIYLIKIAYRNIFRNTRRSILSMAAVGLAVLLIVFFMAFVEGMMDSMKLIATTFESGHIKITTKDYEKEENFMPVWYPVENPDYYIDEIKKIKGVKRVTPRILSYGTFTNSKVKHGIIAGVKIDDILQSVDDKIKYGYYNFTRKSNGLLIGRYPDKNENECAIGYRLAKKMEIIWTVIDKYEFEWLINNIDKEEATLMKDCYKYDESLKSYKLTLFNYQNLPKKEVKRLNKIEKIKYLDLINLFMNIDVKSLPERIGNFANTVEYLLIFDYMKETFLKSYQYDADNEVYNIKNDLKKNEELLSYIKSALELRIPFKILSSQYSDKYSDPRITGVFEYDYITIDESMLIIPYERMQKLASLRNKTQSIFVFAENLKDIGNIKQEISLKFNNPELVIKDWTQFPFLAMFNSFELMYYIIYAVFLIVASFLIINTVLMVIHERIKEIGMMGALGMKRHEIIIVFFLEAFFLSVIGAFFGTFIGGITTLILSYMPVSMEAMMGGIEFPVTNTIFVKFSFMILLSSFLFGSLLTSACTIIPSLKSAFIEPVEALRR
ncbi:MAG: ABC transporter permease [Spirochaetes bacterium]|nr:ABC transporter permease [Spirochaetota bacterium]